MSWWLADQVRRLTERRAERLRDEIAELRELLVAPPNEGDAWYFREQLKVRQAELSELENPS